MNCDMCEVSSYLSVDDATWSKVHFIPYFYLSVSHVLKISMRHTNGYILSAYVIITTSVSLVTIITARKLSLRRLCFTSVCQPFCLQGVEYLGRYTHPRQVHPPAVQQAGGTYPTGMHSCFNFCRFVSKSEHAPSVQIIVHAWLVRCATSLFLLRIFVYKILLGRFNVHLY